MFSCLYEGLAFNWQLMFNEPATAIMLGIVDVHNQVFFYLIIIFFLVAWLFGFSLYTSSTLNAKLKNQLGHLNYALDFEHCTLLEIVWTVAPAFILLAIALPSLALLYAIDELSFSDVTLKVIGRQWYWTYEYPDYLNDSNSFLQFNSNLLSFEDRGSVDIYHYLLSVDKQVVLPVGYRIKALVTASDVLHSWAIPSFGIKIDACPGRLNQVMFSVLREGVYYGQCSELCGVGHGFMPIVINVCSADDYFLWLDAIIHPTILSEEVSDLDLN